MCPKHLWYLQNPKKYFLFGIPKKKTQKDLTKLNITHLANASVLWPSKYEQNLYFDQFQNTNI